MSQKSLAIPAKQQPFELIDRPIPKPGNNDVLVKIQATGLNPVDWMIHQLAFFDSEYPSVIGYDAAGVVEEVGSGVSGFTKGDKVFFQAEATENDRAAYQQCVLVDSSLVAKFPDSLTFDQAATLPTSLLTSATGLYQKPGVGGNGIGLTAPWVEGGEKKYLGKSIVVLGGSSIVGQGAIQWARLSGFSPIVTTASASNESFLKSLGATHVVGRGSNAEAEIKKILDGGATEFVWGAISNEETQKLAIAVTKLDGNIVLSLPAVPGLDTSGSRNIFDTQSLATRNRELAAEILKASARFLQSGELKPGRPEVIPGGLLGIPQGHARLKEGKVSAAKLVIHNWE